MNMLGFTAFNPTYNPAMQQRPKRLVLVFIRNVRLLIKNVKFVITHTLALKTQRVGVRSPRPFKKVCNHFQKVLYSVFCELEEFSARGSPPASSER